MQIAGNGKTAARLARQARHPSVWIRSTNSVLMGGEVQFRQYSWPHAAREVVRLVRRGAPCKLATIALVLLSR